MYETILVGTDGSETAGRAVEHAAELAASVGARLIIASAYHPVPRAQVEEEKRQAPADVAWAINPAEQGEAILSEAKAKAQRSGAADVLTVAVEGTASDVLLDAADKHAASLIVVGSVGLTGAKRFFLGSVPSRVTHHATVDVLVVRTDRKA